MTKVWSNPVFEIYFYYTFEIPIKFENIFFNTYLAIHFYFSFRSTSKTSTPMNFSHCDEQVGQRLFSKLIFCKLEIQNSKTFFHVNHGLTVTKMFCFFFGTFPCTYLVKNALFFVPLVLGSQVFSCIIVYGIPVFRNYNILAYFFI